MCQVSSEGQYELDVTDKLHGLTGPLLSKEDDEDLTPTNVTDLLGVRGKVGFLVQTYTPEFTMQHSEICRGSTGELKGSYLKEVDKRVKEIQAGVVPPLCIRYRYSRETVLVGESDASF